MALALLAISVIFFVETSLRASVTNMTVLVGLALYLSFFGYIIIVVVNVPPPSVRVDGGSTT